MRPHRRILLFVVFALLAAIPASDAGINRRTSSLVKDASPDALITTDLQSGLAVDDVISALLGSTSIPVSNVQYSGSPEALGTFSGGTGIIGFGNGIILSTGLLRNVIGPNDNDAIGHAHSLSGDPDLDSLIPGFETFDAAVLEFDFECTGVRRIGFQYVFASDEYNEFVNAIFNDVFGFFVNGKNIALLPDGQTVVSINSVNGGNPIGDSASNPQFYINNSGIDAGCQSDSSCPYDTEMDGLTIVLIAETDIHPGLNHIKLAIADAGDEAYDSDVFIKGQSFVCGAVNNTPPVCSINPPGPINALTNSTIDFTVTGTDADSGQTIYLSVISVPSGATMTPPLPLAGPYTGISSQFDWQTATPGQYIANFILTDSLGGVDTCEIDINVTAPANTAPVCVLTPPGPFSVNPGANVSFTVSGTDADAGQSIYLSVIGTLPPGASMNPPLPLAGSRTGMSSQFNWTPTQPGTYFARFLLSDSANGLDTCEARIEVIQTANIAPVCAIIPPGPFTVNIGSEVTFEVSGTDANAGQTLVLSLPFPTTIDFVMTPPLPLTGPNTGISSQFSSHPTQLGTSIVYFLLSDDQGAEDTCSAQITVLDPNLPRVVSTQPADGTIDVGWSSRALVQFSERMNPNMLPTAFRAARGEVDVPHVVAVLNDSLAAISPATIWPDDAEVSVRVLGSLRNFTNTQSLDGNGNGMSEDTPLDDYVFAFSTAPGVYPGDANDDGIVDERDVLPIAVHWLLTGPSRQRNFDIWTVEAAAPWTPRPATHADCDGNGRVDSLDICIVSDFFDRVIPAKRSPETSPVRQLGVVEDNVKAALLRALDHCAGGSSEARQRIRLFLAAGDDALAPVPQGFRLHQNYPNPFNAETVISWDSDQSGHVELSLYDILGRKVRTLIDADLPAGLREAVWDGTDDGGNDVASGVYFYRITSSEGVKTRRMVLLR